MTIRYPTATGPSSITLDFPPLLNHYYRTAVVNRHAQTYVSKRGKAYREYVAARWADVGRTYTGDVKMVIAATYPDRRPRDLDGIFKSLLDSLEYAGAYKNDNQVKHIDAWVEGVEKPGFVVVSIARIPPWPSV